MINCMGIQRVKGETKKKEEIKIGVNPKHDVLLYRKLVGMRNYLDQKNLTLS